MVPQAMSRRPTFTDADPTRRPATVKHTEFSDQQRAVRRAALSPR
jgi:hypothetical protein